MLSAFGRSGLWAYSLLVLLGSLNCLLAFKITGATGGVDSTTGARPLRTEIGQFSTSGAPFDLFVLSLIAFQAVNQSNPLSYFQVSGIHGFPRIPWDGVVGTGSYPGFCTHAATPFPTWHRPYMALFEQVLWMHAQDIAATFPSSQRTDYQNAALSLRVPYWDWAINPALPDVVTQPQISINTPSGRKTVKNPLYSYVFQSDAAGNGFPSSDPMANFGETVRWWNTATQSSNQSAANAALMANAPTILSLTYQLFTAVTNYTYFSCTWPGGQGGVANNIEAIHNSIHNSVGGYGHMQFPEVAGFDPVFWLHHANVDRLFAMWQALYPDSFLVPTVNAYGSYYEGVGFVDSGTSALAPFHSDDSSTMFTSDAVRSIKTFGYSYPELPDWEMSASQLAANVRTSVNILYNPISNSTTARKKRSHQPRSANLADSFGSVTLDLARRMNVNNLGRQWSIAVLVDRFAFETSFLIDFFMGEAPADVPARVTAKNLIGTYAQFGPANATLIHPDGYPGGQVQGEISMTHTLAAGVLRGVLQDLSPRSVVPLLRMGLNWKARTAAGQDVPLSDLSGLAISVFSRSLVPTTSRDRFPVYGAVQWQDSVTEGKPQGAGRTSAYA
ncbi:Polyphenol oxidase 1 [Exophiala dermatitidis]